MKQLTILLGLLTIVACKQEPKVDYALFSGKVSNVDTDKIIVTGPNFNKEITLNADGSFADTLNLERNGMYAFKIGRESSAVYLKTGAELNLNLDGKEFDETIAYTGKGAVENNYLAAKFLSDEIAIADPVAFYSLEEAEFKQKADNLKESQLKALKALKNVDDSFFNLEKANIDYNYYGLLNNYTQRHGYYTQKEDFKVSDTFFPEAFNNLTYNDSEAYLNSPAYKQLAMGATLKPIFEAIGNDVNALSLNELNLLNDVKIPQLKQDAIVYFSSMFMSPANPNMADLYNFFVSNSTDETLNKQITAEYNTIKNLIKGKPSPEFTNYENHKGGTMSLSDLKGKYVYIDVWATWCGPCKREIPFLKEVEEQYHGKNIAFVSTSIDNVKDHHKWVDFVKDEKLGGIQLFADNAWQSQFVQDYGIKGIPRFILVDPEGNIVSADAPRPSSPKLVELFTELNI